MTCLRLAWLLLACAGLALAAGCDGRSAATAPADAHDEHDAPADGFERGPHRGRLLRHGDFALEVTIFETGVPPEFHLYAYRNDAPVPASQVRATIELTRLDGQVDRFAFAPRGDVLVGDGVVTEPHSFDVVVMAEHAGKAHRWTYASYEGRTTIPADVAEAAGIRTAVAGPATIHERLSLAGRVVLDPARVADVRARFAGPVREVRAAPGDVVRAGQTLAVVENRDSLRSFAVTAPIAGTVLERNTNVGDVAGDAPLFRIGDLAALAVELHAFGEDALRLAPGQAVHVANPSAPELAADTTMAALLPLASAASQTLVARAALPNPDGRWRPGMAVQADVTVSTKQVPLAVERIGLQRFRDFTVVFAQVGETYEVRMLELGDQDATHAEVLEGLEPGTRYVTGQSFLIKADIEKSGASHDH